ncbi:orotate phosphoribosyltransferase [Streptomyces osmaniensis]|uniref:Orotate phosphoribosyltransferase n=2 Tax=Streptomyces osmaniensis TaxID=593134 RepID=A0ABP6XQ49_9ACTN|nr:orotate phosphoribosyltransferase [Streptomyces sp. JCM17656]
MQRTELGSALVARCALEGEFVLRSGAVSKWYFDKYQFEADPVLLGEVAEHLEPLVPAHTEVLAGLETGGIPLAVALGLVTGLPMAFVRKQAKTYGTARLAEGADISGRRLLIIEDVVVTGGQIVDSVAALRERGAVVDEALCVIDRSDGRVPLLDEAGIKLTSLFRADEINGS